jgi:Rieske Fe-S protein
MKKYGAQSKFNELPKEGGTVIEKENLAIFKDTSGKVHMYSAVCTHLGCIVVWNDLEKSFDCPCHGSRFSGLTGNVISGPANTSLEIKDTDD